MSKFITQTRVSDVLATTMAAGASTCTLSAGNFGSPVGKQIITIDYNVAAKAADFLCTIAGTAVTAMVRLNGPDVEHATNAAVAMNLVDEHANMIFNALDDGWVDPNETPTKGSGQTLTFAGVDRTSTYAVGDKIKLTDTTVKYFYVTAVAFSTNTTLTITGGTDYTLVGSPTAGTFYYSKASSPVGFPGAFAWATGHFKIEDNFLRVYGVVSITALTQIGTTGVYYTDSSAITFPVAFKTGTVPYMSVVCANSSGSNSWTEALTTSATTTTLRRLAVGSYAGASPVHYKAEGILV